MQPALDQAAHGLSRRVHGTAVALRFWDNVHVGPSCWLAATNTFRDVRVQRVGWELVFGRIPPRMVVRSTCGLRRCVNPDHLYIIPGGSAPRSGGHKYPRHRRPPTSNVKLTLAQIKRIKATTTHLGDLGRELGLSRRQLDNIRGYGLGFPLPRFTPKW